MINFSKYLKIEGDLTIWTIVFILLIMSFLLVLGIDGEATSHIRNLFIGLATMYFVHKLKFKYFSKLSIVGMIISIFLLVFVLFLGPEINDARRWITLGSSLSFQPSDLAKIAILVFLSRQISKHRDFLTTWRGFMWYLFLPLSLICLLILPENFSTSAFIFINACFLMFFAKLHYKFLLIIVGVPLITITLIYSMFTGHFSSENIISDSIQNHTECFNKKCFTSKEWCWRYTSIEILPRLETWISRLDGFFYPEDDYKLDEGYQLHQAKIAIKRGKFFGEGPGKGIQKYSIYAPSSDFIFANFIEQYGMIIGAIPATVLYLIFFYRSIIISQRTESLFGALMVASLSFSVILQVIGHMSVNVGLFPVTGQTLPLVSQGGTSIIFTCIAIGIILSVSRNSQDRNYETS